MFLFVVEWCFDWAQILHLPPCANISHFFIFRWYADVQLLSSDLLTCIARQSLGAFSAPSVKSLVFSYIFFLFSNSQHTSPFLYNLAIILTQSTWYSPVHTKAFILGMDNARRSSQYDAEDNLNIIPKADEIYSIRGVQSCSCNCQAVLKNMIDWQICCMI